MKLVQWLARGFHDGRLVEKDDQILVGDDVILGDHMLDVRTGLRGNQAPPPPPAPVVVQLPKIMDLMAQMGAAHPQAIAPDGRLLTYNVEHGGYDYDRPPPVLVEPPSNVVPLVIQPPPSPVEEPPAPLIEMPPATELVVISMASAGEPATDTAPSEAEPAAETPPAETAPEPVAEPAAEPVAETPPEVTE